MAYIGNTATTQAFTAAVDYFSGNGSTTAFTLSRPVASVYQVEAVINNVPQDPATAYTVSGSTITFTSAPPTGSNNIYVMYTSPITQIIQPGQGTVGTAQLINGSITGADLDVASATGTGAMQPPTGTTAQRPSSPTAGNVRFNSTTNLLEIYASGAWTAVGDQSVNYTASYLIAAGGAGGSGGSGSGPGGAGGGAGGLLTGILTFIPGTVYTATVGGGGAGVASGYGTNGSNSTLAGSNIATVTSFGGGGGGYYSATAGLSGGSGGGGGAASALGGSGTAGQGYAGGAGAASATRSAGGGGGASQVGANGVGNVSGGKGGDGLASSITGSSVTYCGGGGGSSETVGAGAGGAGGGGAGQTNGGAAGVSGTTNLGGGGGGGYPTPGSGGSGVVIISVPTANYTGTVTGSPTVTTSGSNTIIKWTSSSGTYTA